MTHAYPVDTQGSQIMSDECERCKGSGEIACRTRNGSYKCAGPVPDDARGVFPVKCEECNGTGHVQ